MSDQIPTVVFCRETEEALALLGGGSVFYHCPYCGLVVKPRADGKRRIICNHCHRNTRENEPRRPVTLGARPNRCPRDETEIPIGWEAPYKWVGWPRPRKDDE